ncbi:hypothetical protein C8R47DRAFT_1221102 [Mycena vitilis]|nr:hypothetical protein C8R47DRAFT_1221102 [Mycena vitilis]
MDIPGTRRAILTRHQFTAENKCRPSARLGGGLGLSDAPLFGISGYLGTTALALEKLVSTSSFDPVQIHACPKLPKEKSRHCSLTSPYLLTTHTSSPLTADYHQSSNLLFSALGMIRRDQIVIAVDNGIDNGDHFSDPRHGRNPFFNDTTMDSASNGLTVVPPRVPLPPPWTWRWGYLNTRGYLYMPVFILRCAGRLLKAIVYHTLGKSMFATRELGARWLFHGLLNDYDYMQGGPGVLPPFFWWRLGLEPDGSNRLPQHNRWMEYKLDGRGGYEITKPAGPGAEGEGEPA